MAMPFLKGNQLWKKAIAARKERLEVRENFFFMLGTGGLSTYADLLDKQSRGVQLEKPQREFMDRVEKSMEFIQAKLQRMEVTGEDGKAVKMEHIIYLPNRDMEPNKRPGGSSKADGG